jgi:hypothetical protein
MYEELRREFGQQGLQNLDLLDELWTTDPRNRKLISGFLKDRTLGEKHIHAGQGDQLHQKLRMYAPHPPQKLHPCCLCAIWPMH